MGKIVIIIMPAHFKTLLIMLHPENKLKFWREQVDVAVSEVNARMENDA